MRKWMSRKFAGWAVFFCVGATICGCGGPNLSDYHRVVKQHRVAKQSESSQPAPDDCATVPGESPASVQTGPETTADAAANSETTSTSDSIDDPEVFAVSVLVPSNVFDGVDVARLLKISARETALAKVTGSQDAVSTSSNVESQASIQKTSEVTVLIPDKTFQVDALSKALRVSFDDLDLLKVLNMGNVSEDAVELMPAWLQSLNGQRVKLRGFMYPTFVADGIERFVLARDNQICCFGRDPKVYDLVQVDMKPGTSTIYIPPTRSFDVVGKFRIEMQAEDGKPSGLYSIENAQIIAR